MRASTCFCFSVCGQRHELVAGDELGRDGRRERGGLGGQQLGELFGIERRHAFLLAGRTGASARAPWRLGSRRGRLSHLWSGGRPVSSSRAGPGAASTPAWPPRPRAGPRDVAGDVMTGQELVERGAIPAGSARPARGIAGGTGSRTGSAPRSGGSPSIGAGSRRGPPTSGTADRRATVYGCWGRAKSSAVGARSTIVPRYITATSSLRYRTTRRSCEMKIIVRPSDARRSRRSWRIWAWIETSRADRGSSAISSSGSTASARAMPTRWRCPPENSPGYLWPSAGLRPTWTRSSSTRRRRAEGAPISWTSSTSREHPVHALARIQRRVRVLEHDLHPLPVGRELRLVELHQVDAVEQHRAAVGVVEPQQAAAERALAAPRLADEARASGRARA